MEQLTSLSLMWLSTLALIQAGVFMFSENDDSSIIKSYIAAWAKTLCVIGHFLVPGDTGEERKESLVAWAFVVLCVPGAIVVAGVVGRMAG